MASVLGISIGTRNVGFAVTVLRKLLDHRIRTYPGTWNDRKCMAITDTTEQFIRRNGITAITVKIPGLSHCSENIMQLIDGIQEVADRHGIPVYHCTIRDLKRQLCVGKKGNKHEVIAALLERYPELERITKDRKRLYVYHSKLFEAIACSIRAQGAGQ